MHLSRAFAGSDEPRSKVTTSSYVRVQEVIRVGGKFFIIGNFTGTLRHPLKTLRSRGGQDVFIVRLNATLKVEQLWQVGGLGRDVANSLIADKDLVVVAVATADGLQNGVTGQVLAIFDRAGQLRSVDRVDKAQRSNLTRSWRIAWGPKPKTMVVVGVARSPSSVVIRMYRTCEEWPRTSSPPR